MAPFISRARPPPWLTARTRPGIAYRQLGVVSPCESVPPPTTSPFPSQSAVRPRRPARSAPSSAHSRAETNEMNDSLPGSAPRGSSTLVRTPGRAVSWISWHLLSAVCIPFALSDMRMHVPMWEMHYTWHLFLGGLALSHLLVAVAVSWVVFRRGSIGLLLIGCAVAVCHGAFFAGLELADIEYLARHSHQRRGRVVRPHRHVPRGDTASESSTASGAADRQRGNGARFGRRVACRRSGEINGLRGSQAGQERHHRAVAGARGRVGAVRNRLPRRRRRRRSVLPRGTACQWPRGAAASLRDSAQPECLPCRSAG